MAKPKRSTETLVQSIREALAEMSENGYTIGIAEWSEADADAGYLVHTDGRLVGLGEYQYGFTHIDDLLSPTLSEEVQKYARSEAGRIAGSLDAIDLDDPKDPFDLRERLPYAFQVDADLVEAAVKADKITVMEMFDFLAHTDCKLVLQGRESTDEDVEVAKDIVARRIKRTEDGTLVSEPHVLVKAGETAKGFSHAERGYAHINVEGGHVSLTADEFVAPAPQPRRPHL